MIGRLLCWAGFHAYDVSVIGGYVGRGMDYFRCCRCGFSFVEAQGL